MFVLVLYVVASLVTTFRAVHYSTFLFAAEVGHVCPIH